MLRLRLDLRACLSKFVSLFSQAAIKREDFAQIPLRRVVPHFLSDPSQMGEVVVRDMIQQRCLRDSLFKEDNRNVQGSAPAFSPLIGQQFRDGSPHV